MSEITNQCTTIQQKVDGINPLKLTPITKVAKALSEETINNLTQQVYLTTPDFKKDNTDQSQKKKKAIATMISNIAPQDEIEGMLAAQMLALHNASLDCLSISMTAGSCSAARYDSLNQANKLSRTYILLMESLNRYRYNDTYKQLTVGRVDVHNGGQAIVGSIQMKDI